MGRDLNSRPPVCETDLRLEGFEQYLNSVLTNKKDVEYVLLSARRYRDVLTTGNAGQLLELGDYVRRQTMRSLSHLAKYNGCYDRWQKIIKQHDLRWRIANDGLAVFEKENITEMLAYIKEAVNVLPKDCANTFLFGTLTGLRADECMKSIRLIKEGEREYVNPEKQILEHYKYKTLFLRRSKKAFISVVDSDTIQLARNSCDSWHKIRSSLKRKKIPMRLKFARKVFATYLVQHGIESQFVDLLQGRTSGTILSTHYYRPDFVSMCDKVRQVLGGLKVDLYSP